MGAAALIFIFFIPESPRVLLVQGKLEQCKRALTAIKSVTGDASPVLPNAEAIRLEREPPKEFDEERASEYRYQVSREQSQYYNSKNGQLYEQRFMSLIYNLTA